MYYNSGAVVLSDLWVLLLPQAGTAFLLSFRFDPQKEKLNIFPKERETFDKSSCVIESGRQFLRVSIFRVNCAD